MRVGLYLALNRYTVVENVQTFILLESLVINWGIRYSLGYDRLFRFGFGFGIGGVDVLVLLVEVTFDH